MRELKKLIATFMAITTILLTFSAVSATAFEDKELFSNLKSEIYYTENLDDNSVIFSKNADTKTAPAGFTKLLAGIVALESWNNLDETVTVTEKSLSLIEYNSMIVTGGIKVGDVIKKSMLLDYLFVYNANDALSIIAYEIAGSEDEFLKLVQDLVSKIGCTNTVIKDIFGFDAQGQYTTALDIAKIMKHGQKLPFFVQSLSKDKLVIGQTEDGIDIALRSSNKMKNAAIYDYYHKAVTFGKQTSTEEAGQCIAVQASQNGYNYLVVVMKGELKDIDNDEEEENTCMTDGRQILNWVYDHLKFKVVVNENQIVHVMEVIAGKNDSTLNLVPETEISALVPSNTTSASVLVKPQLDESLNNTIKAPINAGDVICKASVLYADEEIATINLIAGETIKVSLISIIFAKIADFVGSPVFLIITAIALLAVLIYLLKIFVEFSKRKKAFEEKEMKSRIRNNLNNK